MFLERFLDGAEVTLSGGVDDEDVVLEADEMRHRVVLQHLALRRRPARKEVESPGGRERMPSQGHSGYSGNKKGI